MAVFPNKSRGTREIAVVFFHVDRMVERDWVAYLHWMHSHTEFGYGMSAVAVAKPWRLQ